MAEEPRWVIRPTADPTAVAEPFPRGPLALHRTLPAYAVSPLTELPGVAQRLGVGRVYLKDESNRFGLPAYKMLGASWAGVMALEARLGTSLSPQSNLDALRSHLSALGPLTLVAATDGNHGRAVARLARWLGLEAHILVPDDMTPARTAAIRSEGAKVTRVAGGYDEAVARSAALEDERTLILSDTAWEGYEQIPRWVVEGYSTIFLEAESQIEARSTPLPDLIGVQIGVGALAAATVHAAARWGARVAATEPAGAACMLGSVEAGQIVSLPHTPTSIMAGLVAGRPSLTAWPTVSRGVSLFIAVPDDRAQEAMRLLAAESVVAGESGAAGLAGLLEATSDPALRTALGLSSDTRLLLLNTEADTDPDSYAATVGRPTSEVRGT